MMTRIERKAAWSLALSQGRVVRYNGGLTMRSYPTAEEARMECERFKDAGHHASVVTYPPITVATA